MEMFPGSYQEFSVFFAVLVRVSIVLFVLPVFTARIIPNFTKAGFALSTTLMLYPVVAPAVGPVAVNAENLFRLILGEFLIGMVLSLLVVLFFEGIKMMGYVVGFQTGFAITNVLDPQSRTQVSIMANLAYMVSLILFLTLNGHLIFISALKESFQILPVGGASIGVKVHQLVVDGAGDMFVLSVKIGSPAIVSLLFTKVAFGLITKLIPQMNIMIVAFPVQIIIGLVFFGISLQLLYFFLGEFTGGLNGLLLTTLGWMRT